MLAALRVDRIPPPSVDEFYRVYVHGSQPVAITGLTEDWSAIKRWELSYFADNFGHVRAGAYPLKDGECDVTANRRSAVANILVRDTIASIAEGRVDGGLALASLVDRFPPSLQCGYRVPKYCENGKFLTSRIFLGPAGTLSPLHQDLPENLYVMIKASKRITIFSPEAPVYPARFSKLPNHARVDPERPDCDRFPDFTKAQPYTIDPKAEETLFLPSLWWHHLHNLEPSIAMNFRWPTRWRVPLFGAINLFRKWIKS
jgi:lysine-specific demethylase 8